MTGAERRAALEQIATEVRGCTTCRLHRSRTHAVPGEGSADTEVVFVGEGPGFNEDQQGRPFVGAAGGLLNELLSFIGWRREDVFIANVVKCRPPGNRDPEPDEIAACAPFLRRQLEALDPAVVVTLGRFSLGTFLPGARISSAHGTTGPVDPRTGARDAVAYASYHPAAAFRKTALKETLFAEMANLPQVLLDARAARESHLRAAGLPPPAWEGRPRGMPADGGSRQAAASGPASDSSGFAAGPEEPPGASPSLGPGVSTLGSPRWPTPPSPAGDSPADDLNLKQPATEVAADQMTLF